MKTYSVAILGSDNVWYTNWNEYANLKDIDWKQVNEHCIKSKSLAYGYYYGNNSGNLTSGKNRVTIKKYENFCVITGENNKHEQVFYDGKKWNTSLDGVLEFNMLVAKPYSLVDMLEIWYQNSVQNISIVPILEVNK